MRPGALRDAIDSTRAIPRVHRPAPRDQREDAQMLARRDLRNDSSDGLCRSICDAMWFTRTLHRAPSSATEVSSQEVSDSEDHALAGGSQLAAGGEARRYNSVIRIYLPPAASRLLSATYNRPPL